MFIFTAFFGIIAGLVYLCRPLWLPFYRSVRLAFPNPDTILLELLVPGELVKLQDSVALTAFVIESQEVLIFVASVVFFLVAIVFGWPFHIVLIAFIAVDLLLLHLVVRRLRDYYTRYVITNFRIMRLSGIFTHRNYSIPWVKITDFSWEQSLAGRLFGYATIKIESANEESGLKQLRDLRDPVAFNRKFAYYVRLRQGTVEEPDEAPSPAPVPDVAVDALTLDE